MTNLGQQEIIQFADQVLRVSLQCLEKQRAAAEAVQKDVLSLVRTVAGDQSVGFKLDPLVKLVMQELHSVNTAARLASLQWILMLLNNAQDDLLQYVEELFPALAKTLSDPEEAVVMLDLRVLSTISQIGLHFERFMETLVRLFSSDRPLLDQRCSLIVRTLCDSLGAERVYVSFATILGREHQAVFGGDLVFASLLVQKLNIILLTARYGLLRV